MVKKISIGAMAIFIVLLVLKLTGVLLWSWWIITLPIWFIPAFAIIFLGVMLLYYAINK